MVNKAVDIYNHLLGKKGFDYDQITDGIYMGTNMCCQVGFHRELLVKGVRADISLEEERIDSPTGVDYFLWLPTVDHAAPSQSMLRCGAQAIDSLVKQNIKLYIHCKNGHGRAPTMLAAYLIYTGMTVDEAIAFIKVRRPVIHPNQTQIEALKLFKTNL